MHSVLGSCSHLVPSLPVMQAETDSAIAADAPGVIRPASASISSAIRAPVWSSKSGMLMKYRLASSIASNTSGDNIEPPRSV